MVKVNTILAVGSVDGILTASAVLRGNSGAQVIFTQAFQVNSLVPSQWGEARAVILVDLAVNNREEAMTVNFVKAVLAAGHEIVGICDEHDAEAWQRVAALAGLDYDGLAVKPVSQKTGDVKSSGALWLKHLGSEADGHTTALCSDADAADRMDFSGPLASLANQAVKSKVADNTRRVYLAQHFATNTAADAVISGWVAEYDAILANHAKVVAAKVDMGGGLVQINTRGTVVDVTTLLSGLYGACKVVECIGEAFNPTTKQKELIHAFATGTKLDLLSLLKGAGINAGGFASKANVQLAEADAARAVVLAALKALA